MRVRFGSATFHPASPELSKGSNAWRTPELEQKTTGIALFIRRLSALPFSFRFKQSNNYAIRFFSPHSHIASKIGIKDFPRSVKLYSTFGGICGYSSRWTSPSASNSFSVTLKVLYEIVPFIRDSADVFFQFVESNYLKFHQGIQDKHFIFSLDERHGVVEAGCFQLGILNASDAHFTLSSW